MDKFLEYLNSERIRINKYINTLFQKTIEREEEPYLRKFFKHGGEYMLHGGRRLLPICFVEAFQGLASPKALQEKTEDIYRTSISIEMIHISSLIINDLIGREDLRRGKATFHRNLSQNLTLKKDFDESKIRKYEEATTIYGGNLISFLGADIISKSAFSPKLKNKALLFYQKGLEGISRGRLLNEYYKLIPLNEISLENYLILAGLKRGKQMETAIGLGAIFGNARETQLEPLMQSLNKMGIIAQLVNDLNGSISGDRAKKSIDSDIMNGSCTILTTIAYQSVDEKQKKTLDATLGNQNATPEEIDEVREIYQASGAVDFVKFYSNSLKNDAYNLLQKTYPGLREESVAFFENLLDYIVVYSG